MRTYLELEGKLGPKPQPQTNQFRHPLPNTNPQKIKESKATEKRKSLSPNKKFKAVDNLNSGQHNCTATPRKYPDKPRESATDNLRK